MWGWADISSGTPLKPGWQTSLRPRIVGTPHPCFPLWKPPSCSTRNCPCSDSQWRCVWAWPTAAASVGGALVIGLVIVRTWKRTCHQSPSIPYRKWLFSSAHPVYRFIYCALFCLLSSFYVWFIFCTHFYIHFLEVTQCNVECYYLKCIFILNTLSYHGDSEALCCHLLANRCMYSKQNLLINLKYIYFYSPNKVTLALPFVSLFLGI